MFAICVAQTICVAQIYVDVYCCYGARDRKVIESSP